MRYLLQITLCGLLAAGVGMAQRGGGGGHGGGGGGGVHGGGGFSGGGFHGGGGFGGGGFAGGGFRGGGFAGGGFRGGFGYGYGRGYYGYGRGYYGFYGSYWPYWGLGYGYWPGYYGGYYGGYYPSDYYPYDSYGPYTAGYATSPNVTVVYPQQAQASAPVYVEHASPVMHQYDQYGQEVTPSGGGGGSPIYLIAFQDHTIRAAGSYWVDGRTLHYVTLQHEEKQAPLDAVDRDLSARLNHERHVQLQLPQ